MREPHAVTQYQPAAHPPTSGHPTKHPPPKNHICSPFKRLLTALLKRNCRRDEIGLLRTNRTEAPLRQLLPRLALDQEGVLDLHARDLRNDQPRHRACYRRRAYVDVHFEVVPPPEIRRVELVPDDGGFLPPKGTDPRQDRPRGDFERGDVLEPVLAKGVGPLHEVPPHAVHRWVLAHGEAPLEGKDGDPVRRARMDPRQQEEEAVRGRRGEMRCEGRDTLRHVFNPRRP
mmetsp:Transcript_39810/g.54204  ORF Transcript_39810/g.54204 Transcript_39810/m.54204 type:complete len:230 (-) Transcript_39810:571-1260(-)